MKVHTPKNVSAVPMSQMSVSPGVMNKARAAHHQSIIRALCVCVRVEVEVRHHSQALMAERSEAIPQRVSAWLSGRKPALSRGEGG